MMECLLDRENRHLFMTLEMFADDMVRVILVIVRTKGKHEIYSCRMHKRFNPLHIIDVKSLTGGLNHFSFAHL
jgi:hypothetical protein